MVRFTDIAVITPDDHGSARLRRLAGTKISLFSPKTISRFVAKRYQTYLVTDVIPFADNNNNSVVNFFNYSHNYTREELNMV